MIKLRFFLMLIMTILGVFFLSMLWEFHLEDTVMLLFNKEYHPEPQFERWEYIITVTLFTFIAMIIPAIIGHRLINRQEKLFGKIRQISEEDYLTKLYNRRMICQAINSEINRFNRYNQGFSLVFLDIDHFKKINDTMGHEAGDQVLVEISKSLKKTSRGSDIVGRWGGEEFIIICPETSLDGASKLAENLRTQIESIEITGLRRITASFGVVAYMKGETMTNVVSRVDGALYSAKNTGRNKVVVNKN